tara:strand:+ start:6007 stop:6531 length:525 start_codon:yes stop_codon:yes gene_type:complete
MPRCKNCKEKFEAKHFNQKYCFKSECVKVWVETAKVKNWKKEKKRIKDELETVQSLTKKAQKYFNAFIRLRDKGKDCISCGKKLEGKFDAGHYFSSGGHKILTFNEDNVHGQCVHCNRDLHGNLLQYQIGIASRIGTDRLFELHSKAHDVRKFTREELREIIEIYKQKAKEFNI